MRTGRSNSLGSAKTRFQTFQRADLFWYTNLGSEDRGPAVWRLMVLPAANAAVDVFAIVLRMGLCVSIRA